MGRNFFRGLPFASSGDKLRLDSTLSLIFALLSCTSKEPFNSLQAALSCVGSSKSVSIKEPEVLLPLCRNTLFEIPLNHSVAFVSCLPGTNNR